VATTTGGKRVPRAVRERMMLDAAVAGFARHGYHTASMEEIAEAAGVTKPLVYQYMKSKEDLFTAVVREEAAALVSAVREATADTEAPADQQLWRGLCAFFAHTAARPDGWAVLHRRARAGGEPFAAEVADMRARVVAHATGLLARAAREAGCGEEVVAREVPGFAHALVGAAESLADWANDGPGGPHGAGEAAAVLMNFCWTGLAHLVRGERWTPAR
jgi:AcrR family transcriptional regulator